MVQGEIVKVSRASSFVETCIEKGFIWDLVCQIQQVLRKRDDWFQEFKGLMDMMAQEIIKQLCYDHAKAVRDCQVDGENKIKGTELTNDHLPQIINGCHGDPIEK